MAIIPLTIKDSEAQVRMSEQAVKTCHKESGIPMSELVSLIKRMTKEVKEITDHFEKNSEEMRDFFKKNWGPSFLLEEKFRQTASHI